MKQAEKFHRPVVCFIDTPGAFCGIEAEERGQGEAIARNLYEMSALKEKRALLLERQNSDSAVNRRIQDAVDILNSGSPEITEWDESMIRQLVDTYGEGFDGGQDSGLTPGRYGDRADGRGPVI